MSVSPDLKMSQDRKAVKQRMLGRLGEKYGKRGTMGKVFEKFVYRNPCPSPRACSEKNRKKNL